MFNPERLKGCRKMAGLTCEDLAKKLGVSKQAVSKWETGDCLPADEYLAKMAGIFKVRRDFFTRETSKIKLKNVVFHKIDYSKLAP